MFPVLPLFSEFLDLGLVLGGYIVYLYIDQPLVGPRVLRRLQLQVTRLAISGYSLAVWQSHSSSLFSQQYGSLNSARKAPYHHPTAWYTEDGSLTCPSQASKTQPLHYGKIQHLMRPGIIPVQQNMMPAEKSFATVQWNLVPVNLLPCAACAEECIAYAIEDAACAAAYGACAAG